MTWINLVIIKKKNSIKVKGWPLTTFLQGNFGFIKKKIEHLAFPK